MAALTVGLAGLGAIGGQVARCLARGAIPGLTLAAVSARDRERAEAKLRAFEAPVPVVGLEELPEHGEIVVECVPAAAFRDAAEPALAAGRTLITVSGGALLQNMDLVDLARGKGGRIIVATGALLGLDAVRAAAEGTIERVTMITRKPPGGLKGAPHLERHGIEVDGLEEPLKVFDGTARDGAIGFPANVNVAAALSLAGIGPDRTTLEIWADPGVSRNLHRIVVEADSARFELVIENVPSEENPRTGKITALSVIATLRGLVQPLKVGT